MEKSDSHHAYSSGFDSTLVKLDLRTGTLNKKVDVNALVSRGLGMQLPTPAFVYHIHRGEANNDLVLALETGQLVSVQSKNTDHLRYIIDAHMAKIYHW